VDYNGGLFAGAFGAYASVYREVVSATATGSAATVAATSAVPSGYLYIIQTIDTVHTDGTARKLLVFIGSGGINYVITEAPSIAGFQPILVHRDIVLAAGEVIKTEGDYLASGQCIYLTVTGYKVRLT